MEDIILRIESRVWLICDVNPNNSNWASLKEWLDEKQAQECGSNTYTFYYTNDSSKELRDQLKSDIFAHFTPNQDDRIYAIYRKVEGKYVGSFILGQRQSE